jgi:two-component system NtrC family sensor kinase
MRLLIIDDDSQILRALERMLRRPGYEVVTASGASEAFARLAADERFDAIVCDLHLAGMDGATFYSKLSPMHAERVVFITGGACNGNDADFLSRHHVVYKPFTPKQLLEAVVRYAA